MISTLVHPTGLDIPMAGAGAVCGAALLAMTELGGQHGLDPTAAAFIGTCFRHAHDAAGSAMPTLGRMSTNFDPPDALALTQHAGWVLAQVARLAERAGREGAELNIADRAFVLAAVGDIAWHCRDVADALTGAVSDERRDAAARLRAALRNAAPARPDQL